MIKRSQQQQSAAQSEPLKCPRCESANTKFCYYNNYNRSQPRHFCRACKRHWTKGGTLRNVPVGGARKSNNNNNTNKRPKKPKHSSAAAEARDDQHLNDKSVSEILYQAMMAPAPFQGPLLIPPPPPAAALQLSVGSSPFDGSLSLSGPGPGPGSFHNNLQVAATTNGVITPWQQLMSNNYGSLDCGWNFEDIDSLVSADHIGLPWEDSLDILKP